MKKYIITSVAAIGVLAVNYSNQAKAEELMYKVQSGDSLWKIASEHHLSVQEVMEYNHLSSPTIYVGQELSFTIPNSPQIQTTKYTVKAGDSLSLIARVHNTTVSEIKSINHLSSDIINIGQVLEVPIITGGQTPITTPITKEYTVKSGDSLSVIAKVYNTSVAELRKINNLSSDVIKVGQVIKIPAASNSQLPVVPETAKTYTVKTGDSLSIIAKIYGLTLTQLTSYNNLSSDIIYVGQVLKLSSDGITVPAPKAPELPKVNSSINADELISEAKKYIGVSYVWGGTTPAGFDCSGFLNYVFNKKGISIARTVAALWDAGTSVSNPQKGDIVYYNTFGKGPSHAGIYIGDNKFIHAGTSTGVMITDMNNSYWKTRYLGAKSVK
ncbi:C40 family peptidase [Neobacillus kokaensis]|uniref:D-gamma-glutamyl-meso-diaminopimelic acid endopeptidase CwlS n=1 Tax=Neobacillus kokaensis TaxID=2759023 RepID=A0ABQ3NBC2_9BACI|nr:peptidoglycan endopeptidase [Neobacillus kokaensis]GHI01211.1 D-gamma-glutamyl-meso-diaminopimelic acid endopeptidase CwlS [Neobacillus kokaensis]